MKLILENWNKYLKEAALSPAMYNALKAKGKDMSKHTIKPDHAASTADDSGRTMHAKSGAREEHFDGETGAPLTDKGREMCAKNPECKEKFLKGGSLGRNSFEAAKVLGKNFRNFAKAIEAIPDEAMMAEEIKEDFANFEAKFWVFWKEFRGGR